MTTAALATLVVDPTSVIVPVTVTLSTASVPFRPTGAVSCQPSSVSGVPSYSLLLLSAVICSGAFVMLSVPVFAVTLLYWPAFVRS